MKKIILIATILCLGATLFAQPYKLETVFSEKLPLTYLSHWKALENAATSVADTFSLWGYQMYSDEWPNGLYEVEYFKGSAKEVYELLIQVNKFAQRYKGEENIITNIQGIQIKNIKRFKKTETYIYDKEGKVSRGFTPEQWLEIIVSFRSYCDERKIEYKASE